MAIELHVLSGSRAGERPAFDKSIITIGRHPSSDLQFDPNEELVVSARHAEIRTVDGRTTVRDVGSRNGTFVNGQRVAGEVALANGDEILLGTDGPRLKLVVIPSHLPVIPSEARDLLLTARPKSRPFVAGAPQDDKRAKPSTDERVAVAVRKQTRGMRVILGLAVLVLGSGVAGAYWLGHRAPAVTTASHVDSARPVQQSGALTPLKLSEISARNDAGVAFLATELDGKPYGSTAFGVTSDGLLITNRHNVRSATGQPPSRVLVKYANSAQYLPARVVGVSTDDSVDLALLQVDGIGPFPAVSGVAQSTSELVAGASVVTIGFPHSLQTPQAGDTVKTSLFAGTVSKHVSRLLQIDAYAGHGSSGSPIFDGRGLVVGVVWGGDPDSNGRITYAVPSERIAELLPATARGVLK